MENDFHEVRWNLNFVNPHLHQVGELTDHPQFAQCSDWGKNGNDYLQILGDLQYIKA